MIEIGNRPSLGSVSAGKSVPADRLRSTRLDGAQVYTAVAGDFISEVGITVYTASSGVDVKIHAFNVSGVTMSDRVVGASTIINIDSSPSSTATEFSTSGLNIPLVAGQEIALAIQPDSAITGIADDSGTEGENGRQITGTYPNEIDAASITGDGSINRNHAIWAIVSNAAGGTALTSAITGDITSAITSDITG